MSIPSVAIADFAARIFERFDDKRVLVIGAGKMAQETLQYLVDAGARHITVLNRDFDRAADAGRRVERPPGVLERAVRRSSSPPTWS